MIDPIALRFPLFGNVISIHWYGIIIAVGMLLAILLAMRNAKHVGLVSDDILDIALIAVPASILGARLYYVAFMWNEIYAYGPFWKIFAIWEGGMAIYGGVIGGFLGVWIYTRISKKNVSLMALVDLLSPSLILGQAIGRWGNFVNQEAYGYAITNSAWQWFPAAVHIQADIEYPWHMATFFYESMWNFLVFAFLLFYFKRAKNRKTGDVFYLYLLLYGLGRFVIEGLRTDSLYWGTFRVSQLLSAVLVLAASAGLIYNHFVKDRRSKPEQPLDESLRLFHTEEPTEEPVTDDGGQRVEDAQTDSESDEKTEL